MLSNIKLSGGSGRGPFKICQIGEISPNLVALGGIKVTRESSDYLERVSLERTSKAVSKSFS